MNDMNLMLVGIVVFGLMLTGAVMTVLEFRQLSEKDRAQTKSSSDSSQERRQ